MNRLRTSDEVKPDRVCQPRKIAELFHLLSLRWQACDTPRFALSLFGRKRPKVWSESYDTSLVSTVLILAVHWKIV